MLYKTVFLNDENVNFFTETKDYSSSNIIHDDELCDYLEFNVYEVLQSNCLGFVQSIEIDNFIDANKIIKYMYDFFSSNKEKLTDLKVDFSQIIKIFSESGFFYSLFYAVNDRGEDYIPNCAALICVMTYVSDEFIEVLSEKDFICPLTNYYIENFPTLTPCQKLNIVNSINNLILFYQDKNFAIFFENRKRNFYEIFNLFGEVMPNNKLLKFINLILINGNEQLKSIYPLILDYYVSKIKSIFDDEEINEDDFNEKLEEEEEEDQQPDEKIKIFNMALLLIYRLLKKDNTIIDFLFLIKDKPCIIEDIGMIYRKNHKKLSAARDIIKCYYSLGSLIIRYYDINATEDTDLTSKRITIIGFIDLGDIIWMLQCKEDFLINSCALILINALIKKKLFIDLFQEQTIENGEEEDKDEKIMDNIFNLLDDSPFDVKKKAFDCLYHMIKFDYLYFAETILKRLDTSLLCDILESGDGRYQRKVVKFINFALRRANIENSPLDQDSLKKSFALNIYEDEDLDYCLQSFSCPENKDLENQVSLVYHQVKFWVNA